MHLRLTRAAARCRRPALALLAAALLEGAAGGRYASAQDGVELRAAPTRVTVDGRRLTLTASLARHGRTLQAVLDVGADDGKAFPTGVRVTRAWIVVGDGIWEAPALDEQDAAEPGYRDARGTPRNRPGSPVHRVVVRGGPAWDAGTRADAVVRLTDADGRSALLRVPRQTITLAP